MGDCDAFPLWGVRGARIQQDHEGRGQTPQHQGPCQLALALSCSLGCPRCLLTSAPTCPRSRHPRPARFPLPGLAYLPPCTIPAYPHPPPAAHWVQTCQSRLARVWSKFHFPPFPNLVLRAILQSLQLLHSHAQGSAKQRQWPGREALSKGCTRRARSNMAPGFAFYTVF